MSRYPLFLLDMVSIWVAIGCSVGCTLLALIVCYFLPKAKIREANQLLEKEEQEKRLQIKELEKEYLTKEHELDKEFFEKLTDLQVKNNNLWDEQRQLLEEIDCLRNSWELEKAKKETELAEEIKDLQVQLAGLEERRASIIKTLEEEAQESGRIFKEQQLKIVEEQITLATNEMQARFEQAQSEASEVYLQMLEELAAETMQKSAVSAKEIEEGLQKLAEIKAKVDAAVEVNKRAELEKQKKDFYRLQLTDTDIEEIKRIRSIEPYLRDKEPLNKVIWKSYYEKPYTDLIGRVVGGGRKTGIYKITNIENQMCYIGQAVDIADRWKQHIKRGIGAETPTRNKLYPAMLAIGVENFTFEIVEVCASKDLNAREDYWQDFYHAKDFGYSIK